MTGRHQFQLQKKTADGPGYAAADRITMVVNGYQRCT